MPLQQRFRPTAALSVGKLKEEITAVIGSISKQDLLQSGIAELDTSQLPSGADFSCDQKAGIALESIVITFASKVAYDVWKEIILPKLRIRYGGAALAPVAPVRKVSAAGRK